MPVASNAQIIGITGSFGSGCSTLRSALEDQGYTAVSLSNFVKEKWSELNGGKSPSESTRKELQTVGDDLREANGNEYLSRIVLENLDRPDSPPIDKVVIDSIRHPDEAAYFRNRFQNFYLIAVDASFERRWERLRTSYESRELTIDHFRAEDKRDADEDSPYGQKVQLCVDDSDIVILNDENYESPFQRKTKAYSYIDPYLRHILGTDLLTPSPDESMMAIAYSIALKSSCYKRQVGAVIINEEGTILAVGRNENPPYLGSCYDAYGECFRDIFKRRVLEAIKNTEECPDCKEKLTDNISGNLKCKKCGFDLDSYFIRDRALSRCTALHAEETAIINARESLSGCTIYTTTFPCLLCAEKIVATRINTVVYCESYPDADSTEFINKVKQNGSKIEIRKFKGVKARAYFRLFGQWRSQMEDAIRKKKGA